MADRIELTKSVGAILLAEWDPIGIQDVPLARDEYDRYADEVAKMILAGNTVAEISEYLVSVEPESMGLNADRNRAQTVAGKLCRIVNRRAEGIGG